MPVTITHEVKIAVTAEVLFNYVTQPWLWHQWHPSSQSASAAHTFLAAGDEFNELIMVQPLAPLPPRLIRSVDYSVTEAFPYSSWKVEGKMKDARLQIRYDFLESEGQAVTTVFQRTLTFELNGPMRLLQAPLKRKMKHISGQAMGQLKIRMETL